MISLNLLVAASLIGLGAPLASAQVDSSQVRTIQGYATGCKLYEDDQIPVIKLKLYSTKAEALASLTSPKPARTDVILEFGPGVLISQFNPESYVKLICAAVEAQKAETPIIVRTNSKNVVESVVAYGHDLKSDSFALMPPNAQKVISDLMNALFQREQSQQGERSDQGGKSPQGGKLREMLLMNTSTR
jgi:hypothetical protein